jgi:hypothetical protein
MHRVLGITPLALLLFVSAASAQTVCDKRPTLASCQKCVESGSHVRKEFSLAQRQAWCRQFYDEKGRRIKGSTPGR